MFKSIPNTFFLPSKNPCSQRLNAGRLLLIGMQTSFRTPKSITTWNPFCCTTSRGTGKLRSPQIQGCLSVSCLWYSSLLFNLAHGLFTYTVHCKFITNLLHIYTPMPVTQHWCWMLTIQGCVPKIWAPKKTTTNPEVTLNKDLRGREEEKHGRRHEACMDIFHFWSPKHRFPPQANAFLSLVKSQW